MTYEQFISKIDKMIWKLAHKYSTKLSDADDMYQECLLKCYEVYTSYNGENAVTTYIRPILINHLLNLIRDENTQTRCNKDNKGNNIKDIKTLDLDRFATETNYNDIELELLDVAYTLIKGHKQSEILTRLIIYGETQKSIADDLGVTRANISKHYRKFIEEVKRVYEGEIK